MAVLVDCCFFFIYPNFCAFFPFLVKLTDFGMSEAPSHKKGERHTIRGRECLEVSDGFGVSHGCVG
jgi:hypothetical protein